MPRQRREIPWLQERDGVYYVYWHAEGTGRTKRLSLRTTDSVEAQKRYAAFLAQGHAIFDSGGSSKLTVSQALDDYWREHVQPNVVDKGRQEDAIGHLKWWFAGDDITGIDIPASRAYGLIRRAGVVGGGKRKAPIADEAAYGAALHKFKGAFAEYMAKTAREKKDPSIDRIREMAAKCEVREDLELLIAAGSDSTIRRELVVLQAAANHASEWKRIGQKASPPTSMPSIELPPEAPPAEAPWLTKEELKTAFNSATGRTKDWMEVAYYSAGRRASVERLTIFQVKLSENRINLRADTEDVNQRRSKKRRPVVPIDPMVRPTVERLMREAAEAGSEWLFGANRDMYRGVHAHLKSLGFSEEKCHPHVLRHSRATHLLQSGVPIYDVARLLGDTVATVERVYGHHCPEYLAETIKRRTE